MMPNTLVPATGEAVAASNASLSRRRFLGGVAITAIPSAAVAIEVGRPQDVPMSAQERFDFHLAAVKKAAEELDPMIGHWNQNGTPGDEARCVFILSAHRRTGQYEGDGKYERGTLNWNGGTTIYQVKLLSDRIDDERLFEVTCPGEKMQMIESRLNTFIGRRLS
jgi:hypothetical protein